MTTMLVLKTHQTIPVSSKQVWQLRVIEYPFRVSILSELGRSEFAYLVICICRLVKICMHGEH